jgi:hypothetical protein
MTTENGADAPSAAERALFEAVRGYWAVKPVTAQPSLTLVRWQVMQLPSGDRHFVGYALEAREGRTSSAVKSLDVTTMRGVTSGGRVYELRGKPDWDGDAETVWRAWCRINEAQTYEDGSQEVWREHLALQPAGDGQG